MHTEYTTIAKLILCAAKKVNDGHTVGQRDRMRPSRDAWTRCASQDQDGKKFSCGRKTTPTTGKPDISWLVRPQRLYTRWTCVSRVREARGKTASIGDAPLVQQPGMDNLPLVAPAWPEIQKRRPPVLKLVIKLQRVSCCRRWWINGLSLKPTIPFQKQKGYPFVLSH
jgi:hypothetical protein